MSSRIDRRTFLAATAGAGLCLGVSRRSLAQAEVDVAELVRRRVDVEKRTVGMAVALVTPRDLRIVGHGRLDVTTERMVTGKSIFEIGSVTKVFTALLLADMARRGLVAIDDPADRYLPDGLVLPAREGRRITLADLATHTAGLPRYPPFADPVAMAVPAYRVGDLKAWLDAFALPRAPGSAWEYSNVGYAILGVALAHRAGRSYAELLSDRIIHLLGLSATSVQVPASLASRVAEGHDSDLKPLPPYDRGLFAPAGALHSSAEDLSRFTRAVLPGSRSQIEAAAQFLLKTQRPARDAGGMQALGWEVLPAREGQYVSKDGVTTSQHATVVYDEAARRCVITLSNTAPLLRGTGPSGGGTGAADLARHLLRPSIPLGPPPG